MNQLYYESFRPEAPAVCGLVRPLGVLGLAAGLLAAGCSPYAERTYGTFTEGGAVTTTGADSADGAQMGNTDGGGSGGSNDSGGSDVGITFDGGEDRPVPTKGLVVVGGTTLDGVSGIISVLNPQTGKEIARQALLSGVEVAGIAYDGAKGKDVWYVFVGSDFPAKADKVVELQVRYFNEVTNSWMILSKTSTLPPPIPDSFAVLNDRLAYLSHVVKNNVAVAAITLLDTSNVKAVSPIVFDLPMFNGTMTTLLGTRGTAVDPAGTGGVLDVGVQQNCVGAACDLFVQPIPVGSTVGTAIGHVLGTFSGTPVAAASRLKQLDYFALPPATMGSVKVYRSTPDAPESALSFLAPPSARDLRGLTSAECQDIAIFTADTEHALYGVSLSSGFGKAFDLGRPGQLVAYEPFTTNVISTFNPTGIVPAMPDAGQGPEITAISVLSPLPTSLTLQRVPAAGWSPPTDVRPNVLATRFPVPFKCP